MSTSNERFSDASALLSYIESRSVREARERFAWQIARQKEQDRRELVMEYITTGIAAVIWVAIIVIVSGMLFQVGTDF